MKYENRRRIIGDHYTNVFEIKLIYILGDGESIDLTRFYYFQYQDANKPISFMIYPYHKERDLESICFKEAQARFNLIMAAEAPNEVLKQLGNSPRHPERSEGSPCSGIDF